MFGARCVCATEWAPLSIFIETNGRLLIFISFVFSMHRRFQIHFKMLIGNHHVVGMSADTITRTPSHILQAAYSFSRCHKIVCYILMYQAKRHKKMNPCTQKSSFYYTHPDILRLTFYVKKSPILTHSPLCARFALKTNDHLSMTS